MRSGSLPISLSSTSPKRGNFFQNSLFYISPQIETHMDPDFCLYFPLLFAGIRLVFTLEKSLVNNQRFIWTHSDCERDMGWWSHLRFCLLSKQFIQNIYENTFSKSSWKQFMKGIYENKLWKISMKTSYINCLWKVFMKTSYENKGKGWGDLPCQTRVSSSLIGSQTLSALRRGLTVPKFWPPLEKRLLWKFVHFIFFLLSICF